MAKNINLVIAYTILVLSLNDTSPSGFMLLFSLLAELILLFGVYAFFMLQADLKHWSAVLGMLIIALPILFCQYVMALVIGGRLGEYDLADDDLYVTFLEPYEAMGPTIYMSLFLLVLAYLFSAYDFARKKQGPDAIVPFLRYQVLLVCAVGAAGFGMLDFAEYIDKFAIVAGMAAMRLMFEFILYRTITKIPV